MTKTTVEKHRKTHYTRCSRKELLKYSILQIIAYECFIFKKVYRLHIVIINFKSLYNSVIGSLRTILYNNDYNVMLIQLLHFN